MENLKIQFTRSSVEKCVFLIVIFNLASKWAQGVKSDRCNFWILHVWSEVINAEHRNIYGVFLSSLRSHGVCVTCNEYKGGTFVSRDGSSQI